MRGEYADEPVQRLLAAAATRDTVVEALREAVSDGSMSLEEFQRRLNDAYAAQTAKERIALVADLDLVGRARAKKLANEREVDSEGDVTYTGRWRVPRRLTISASGNILLDFTDAVIEFNALHVRLDQESGDSRRPSVTFIVKSGITVDINGVRSRDGHVRVSHQTDPRRPGILRITVTGEVEKDIAVKKRKLGIVW